jgi:hypothetical protein
MIRTKASAVKAPTPPSRRRRDLLELLLEERFPQIWVPSGENRDLRQWLMGPPTLRG